MDQNLFRKKSMERVSSPEQLDDYLHVTTPAVWVVLLAVVLLLAGFLFWSSTTTIESYVTGNALAEDGILTITFDEDVNVQRIEEGMEVQVGELEAPLVSVGNDEEGNTMAIAKMNMPDGRYQVKVGYKKTQIMDMLFN